jgi:hypothetical protein
MAHRRTLGLLDTQEAGAMHAVILPDSFLALLAPFAPCFTAPSYRTFQTLVAGWVHCLGRRTVTAVVVAAGAVGDRHLSVFHRFFARAAWALDDLGNVVFALALPLLPADQPLLLLLDDTLCRKSGKSICRASMHHDPLRSTARKPFFSFGHVWVVLALWVPLPWDRQRGVALPLLFRLYTSTKRGGRADAPSRPTPGRRRAVADAVHAAHLAGARPTKLELARTLIAIVARWAGDRAIHVAVDSAYAGRCLLEDRPATVHLISRLRMDAALWTLPPKRRPGQRGRPRRRGVRLPTPRQLAARCRHWHPMSVTLYGRPVTAYLWQGRVVWYGALRTAAVRMVIVHDPTGKRQDEAFFCTDLTLSAGAMLTAYARRWTLEVTFHDAKQYLGLEDAQKQAVRAVERTAPLAGLVYALVVLWYVGRVEAGAVSGWMVRPWFRAKATPSFADMLTALRVAGWRAWILQAPSRSRRRENPPVSWPDAVLATA